MKPPLHIRQARPEDQQAIWSIFREVVSKGDSYCFDPKISQQNAMDYWMGNGISCYIAEYDSAIAGTYIIKDNQASLGAHIANASFMVSANFQGKSIGTQMGEHALEEAKRLGYHAMQFNMVISTNKSAIHLWQKLGFKIIGTIPDAFQHQPLHTLVDAYIMYKKL